MAHRSSIYGAVKAATTTPLLPIAKDTAWEANAGSNIRMLHGISPPQPPILDEVFEDYHRLFSAADVETPHGTLPRFDPYAPMPVNSNSGKCTVEKADLNDDGTSGTILSRGPTASATAATSTEAQEGTFFNISESTTERDAALMAFLVAPHLPAPNQVKPDHVSALLSLLIRSRE